MGIVKIEGKDVTVPDDVINAGAEAVRAVLAASGFPAVENADIQIESPARDGAPAIVRASPRSTGKGCGEWGSKGVEEGSPDSWGG